MQSMSDPEHRLPREPLVPPGGIELFARDMTATIAADVPLQEVQRKLAELDQWLPIDGDPRCAVGALVEMNSTGPLRLGYGAWRDLLLGCQFTNGRGELITAGGRVFKNVAGYDLTKLMVGQQGILGRIATITTRTYKRPQGAMIVKFPAGVGLVNRLLPTACRPQWMVLNAEGLYCGYVGDLRMIEFMEGAIAAFSPIERRRVEPAEEVLRRFDLWAAPAGTEALSFRASVPPARIMDFIEKGRLAGWAADAAMGIVRGGCSAEALVSVRRAAGEVGGLLWREGAESIEDLGIDAVQRACSSGWWRLLGLEISDLRFQI